MANALMAYKNRSDAAVLTGGSWLDAAPLTNMQVRDLSLKAQSIDTNPANSTFDINMGSDTYNQAFALIDTNLSTTATVRLIVANDPLFAVPSYDTGTRNMYDAIYDSTVLEWEDDNWWSGQPSEDDLSGYKRNFIHIPPTLVYGQYARWIITDADSPDHGVRIGRLFTGPIWQFAINPDYGASIAYESNSLVDTSLGGVDFIYNLPASRVLRFTNSFMQSVEAYQKALEITRKQDVGGEILFVLDNDDTANRFRTSFWARMRALNPLTAYAYALFEEAFELKELI